MNQVLPKGPRGPEKFRITKYRRPSMAPKNREKRNEWYSRLTTRQKRVAIAEDAIAQVLAKKFVPEQMTMVSISSKSADRLEDAQAEIDDKAFECSVCERGALLISCVRLGDGVGSIRDLERQTSRLEQQRLWPVFGKTTLRRLETLFEGWSVSATWSQLWQGERITFDVPNGEQVDAMQRWMESKRSWKPRTRMLELMRNMAKNDGDLILYGVKISEDLED